MLNILLIRIAYNVMLKDVVAGTCLTNKNEYLSSSSQFAKHVYVKTIDEEFPIQQLTKWVWFRLGSLQLRRSKAVTYLFY